MVLVDLGKGVSFFRKRLETHPHKFYRENKSNEGYILIMDFSNYYGNINHKKCLELFKEYLYKTDLDEETILITLDILLKIMRLDDKGTGVGINIRKST